jgi:PhnB protein
MTQPIPTRYNSRILPYLIVSDAEKAIAFYTEVFGAKERFRLPDPTGGIMHAELDIGGTVFMLADNCMGSTLAGGGRPPMSLYLYVEDVDSVFEKALAYGSIERMPVQTHFYGDRAGSLSDPFGHGWQIASRVEDITTEELHTRFVEGMKAQNS